MKDGSCQLNMAKMTRTLRHPFTTSLALEVTVDSAHAGVHQPAHLGLVRRFIHNLWILDFGNGDGFLKVVKGQISA